jgi:hypothetical protein
MVVTCAKLRPSVLVQKFVALKCRAEKRSAFRQLRAVQRSPEIGGMRYALCFDGRNLALRLAALGCTNVYWYRGGREAWEVNGLPETTLDLQDW